MLRTALIFVMLASTCMAQKESVARVDVSQGSGSCVVIKIGEPVADGFYGEAITAYHVVCDDTTFKVSYFNGRSCSNCSLIRSDKKNDIALIRVWTPKDVPAVEIGDVEIDDDVSIIGYPFGNFGTRDGRVLNIRVHGEEYSLYAHIHVQPGYSGGGLFKKGKLVGNVSGGWFWDKDDRASSESRPSSWPTKTCGPTPIRNLLKEALPTPIQ